MNFITPYQREKVIKKRVAEKLKDHQFTELENTDEVQIYRCRNKSESFVHGFDIILAPGCIVVNGVTDRVLYKTNEGLVFLAEHGSSWYGLKQLDDVYKNQKEVSAYLVAKYFYESIYEYLGFDEVDPEALKAPYDIDPDELKASFDQLRGAVQSLHENDACELPDWLREVKADKEAINCFHCLLEELSVCLHEPNEQELYKIINDTGFSEINPDWYETSFTVAGYNLEWITACAEYAAGRILEQQKKAA